MIRPILIGIAAGMRSLTPIAVISWAAKANPKSTVVHPTGLFSSPVVSKLAFALAAAELVGDKVPSAPDRIITLGLLARIATGALSGMAVARPRQQLTGAVLGATAAVGAAYVSCGVRQRAIRKYGRASTGLLEDALALGAAVLVARTRHLHRNAQQ